MNGLQGRLRGRDRFWVPASLWLSYLANDGEEWLTMAPSMARTVSRLPGWLPVPPMARQMDDRHVRTGVLVMGALYGAAVVDGWRSAGRGRLYQDVQRIFGLHGLGHLSASAALRQYTSGVLTSPTVVLPQHVWAQSRLRRAGVPDVSSLRRGVVVVGAWLAMAHAVGHRASEAARSA